MAMTVLNPLNGAVVTVTQNVSANTFIANILIELRVANLLALELARGNTTVTLESLRLDVVNEVLPLP